MAPKEMNEKISALGIEISVASTGTSDDRISLTDIARYKSDETKIVIQNWMCNRNTLEFLGARETLNTRLQRHRNRGLQRRSGLELVRDVFDEMDNGHRCHRYQDEKGQVR